jgi:hypothetical protein
MIDNGAFGGDIDPDMKRIGACKPLFEQAPQHRIGRS